MGLGGGVSSDKWPGGANGKMAKCYKDLAPPADDPGAESDGTEHRCREGGTGRPLWPVDAENIEPYQRDPTCNGTSVGIYGKQEDTTVINTTVKNITTISVTTGKAPNTTTTTENITDFIYTFEQETGVKRTSTESRECVSDLPAVTRHKDIFPNVGAGIIRFYTMYKECEEDAATKTKTNCRTNWLDISTDKEFRQSSRESIATTLN